MTAKVGAAAGADALRRQRRRRRAAAGGGAGGAAAAAAASGDSDGDSDADALALPMVVAEEDEFHHAERPSRALIEFKCAARAGLRGGVQQACCWVLVFLAACGPCLTLPIPAPTLSSPSSPPPQKGVARGARRARGGVRARPDPLVALAGGLRPVRRPRGRGDPGALPARALVLRFGRAAGGAAARGAQQLRLRAHGLGADCRPFSAASFSRLPPLPTPPFWPLLPRARAPCPSLSAAHSAVYQIPTPKNAHPLTTTSQQTTNNKQQTTNNNNNNKQQSTPAGQRVALRQARALRVRRLVRRPRRGPRGLRRRAVGVLVRRRAHAGLPRRLRDALVAARDALRAGGRRAARLLPRAGRVLPDLVDGRGRRAGRAVPEPVRCAACCCCLLLLLPPLLSCSAAAACCSLLLSISPSRARCSACFCERALCSCCAVFPPPSLTVALPTPLPALRIAPIQSLTKQPTSTAPWRCWGPRALARCPSTAAR